jgi:hypothetical protein
VELSEVSPELAPANEKEKVMISDVYDSMKWLNSLSMWSLIGMYGLFAASVYVDRKKKDPSAP